MSDADSHFNINLSMLKNNNFKIQRQWRLEFAQKTYHGIDQTYWALWISAFLNTTLYTRSRIAKNRNGNLNTNKLYSSFIVVAHNPSSLEIIKNYFEKYPLKSSKYMDYKDWIKCEEYIIEYKKTNQSSIDKNNLLKNIKNLKTNMNKNRNTFNWDHLNNF